MKSEAVNEEKLQEVENNYPMTPWPQFELPHDPDMNRDSGGDGIPAELFQILKDDAVKVLHSICQWSWKTQQRPQDWWPPRQGDRVPDKSHFYDKKRDTERPGSQRHGLGL